MKKLGTTSIQEANGVKAIQINFGDGEATTISTTDYTDESGAWYDMQGRKFNGKPTVHGIYINNGKKVAVK